MNTNRFEILNAECQHLTESYLSLKLVINTREECRLVAGIKAEESDNPLNKKIQEEYARLNTLKEDIFQMRVDVSGMVGLLEEILGQEKTTVVAEYLEAAQKTRAFLLGVDLS
jgi:hypothetical protein